MPTVMDTFPVPHATCRVPRFSVSTEITAAPEGVELDGDIDLTDVYTNISKRTYELSPERGRFSRSPTRMNEGGSNPLFFCFVEQKRFRVSITAVGDGGNRCLFRGEEVRFRRHPLPGAPLFSHNLGGRPRRELVFTRRLTALVCCREWRVPSQSVYSESFSSVLDPTYDMT